MTRRCFYEKEVKAIENALNSSNPYILYSCKVSSYHEGMEVTAQIHMRRMNTDSSKSIPFSLPKIDNCSLSGVLFDYQEYEYTTRHGLNKYIKLVEGRILELFILFIAKQRVECPREQVVDWMIAKDNTAIELDEIALPIRFDDIELEDSPTSLSIDSDLTN